MVSKRICIIRQGYFPDDTRVHRQVLALLEEGHEVHIVCMRDEGERRRESWRGANVYRLPLTHRRRGALVYLWEYVAFFLAAMVAVTILDARHRFDVVQVNTLPDVLVFAAWVAKLRGAQVVIDFHELMPEMFADLFGDGAARMTTPILTVLERAAARYADRVVIANPVQDEILKRRAGLRRAAVVLNVPPEGVFAPGEDADGHERLGSSALVRVLTHGTLVERYGVHVLIRALPLILRERAVLLEVYGGGEQQPELEALTAELDLKACVSFTFWLPPDQLAQRIRDAAVGVVPIIPGYLETVTPNKLFDYVATGVPVVASDTPGIRACFDDRAVAFAKPGDPASLAEQILRVLGDAQLADSLRTHASQAYERFRWGATKRDYTSVFAELERGARDARALAGQAG